MGNSVSSSRSHHDDTVDYGSLTPHGVYTGPRDWNHQIVTQLIVERRLAPFYRPLEDYEDSWDDEQILAARKEFPEQDVAAAESSSRSDAGCSSASRSSSVHSNHSARRSAMLKEPCRLPEVMVYRGAVECPICFLYYPPNINRSRCCDQAICTECFVQIKRAEPTTTHVVSEPAACPFCVQDNFGVAYTPPSCRAGIGADTHHQLLYSPTTRTAPNQSSDSGSSKNSGKRKSLSADSPEVVTIDQIRPDWEAKLAAVRAAVARRANRRIIMRQVGDRLIPVGITSGRIHTIPGDLNLSSSEPAGDQPNEGESRTSRRSRRRQQQQVQDLNQLLGTMGLGGQDLEEFMVMEAMRLSLLEHEEHQRREAEKRRRVEEQAVRQGSQNTEAGAEAESLASTSASRSELPPIPSPSPIDVGLSSEFKSMDVDPERDTPSTSLTVSGSATPEALRLENAAAVEESGNEPNACSRSATATCRLPILDMFSNGVNKATLSAHESLLESKQGTTGELVHSELQKENNSGTTSSKGEASLLFSASTSRPREE